MATVAVDNTRSESTLECTTAPQKSASEHDCRPTGARGLQSGRRLGRLDGAAARLSLSIATVAIDCLSLFCRPAFAAQYTQIYIATNHQCTNIAIQLYNIYSKIIHIQTNISIYVNISTYMVRT